MNLEAARIRCGDVSQKANFSCFFFTPKSFPQFFVVALSAAAASPVLDDSGSFELNDETREGFILGLGMGYLQGKNMDRHIDGKNIEQLLGEGDLSHRGLAKRSPKKFLKFLVVGNILFKILAPPTGAPVGK